VTSRGRLFKTRLPATGKARSPTVASRGRWTTNNDDDDERQGKLFYISTQSQLTNRSTISEFYVRCLNLREVWLCLICQSFLIVYNLD